MKGERTMDGPRYDGLIEQWKVELIEGCARRMGFPNHEMDDLKQDIVPELIAFEFDEARSNGAKESTAIQALIMNQLRNKRRGCIREHAKIERYKLLMPRSVEVTPSKASCKLDVHAAVCDLKPSERRICRRLANGDSIEATRKQMGCGWHTIDRAVGHLRDRFRKLELDGWLGK